MFSEILILLIICSLKGRCCKCISKDLVISTKHGKTFFFDHIVKNIVNYQLQKCYFLKMSTRVKITLSLRHGVTVACNICSVHLCTDRERASQITVRYKNSATVHVNG